MPNSYGSWRTGVQIDNIYPVGSFYFSANSTNPSQLFGGTWEQVTGCFLFAADSSHAAGTTGGSLTMAHTHTLSHTHSQVAVTSGGPSNNTSGSTAISIAQMPSHAHRTTWTWSSGYSDNGAGWGFSYTGNKGRWSTSVEPAASGLEKTGGGQGHTHTLSSHTHSIAATTTGGASATTTSGASNTSIMPPYLSVYVFKRIS